MVPACIAGRPWWKRSSPPCGSKARTRTAPRRRGSPAWTERGNRHSRHRDRTVRACRCGSRRWKAVWKTGIRRPGIRSKSPDPDLTRNMDARPAFAARRVRVFAARSFRNGEFVVPRGPSRSSLISPSLDLSVRTATPAKHRYWGGSPRRPGAARPVEGPGDGDPRDGGVPVVVGALSSRLAPPRRTRNRPSV